MIISSKNGSYISDVEDALVGDFMAAKGDLALSKRDLSKSKHLNGINFIDIEAKVEALICIAHWREA